MSVLAPGWALGAQAISSRNDPHLAPGIHLRLFVDPKLGLPIFPFRVYRVNLGSFPDGGAVRTDSVIWTDSSGAGGATKTTPPSFLVQATNAVTAWLPPASVGTCCWMQVDVPPDPPRIVSEVPSHAASQDAATEETGPAVLGTGDNTFDMRALVEGKYGPAVVARAAARPWQMAASRIERVRVEGSGEILGVRWLDAKRFAPSLSVAPWRLWSLPVPSGQSYSNIGSFSADADARVSRGAPKRLAMYDALTSTPATAPSIFNPGAADVARMAVLAAQPKAWLNTIINSGATLPYEATDIQQIKDDQRPDIGTATINCLSAVLSACLDASMARCLGFADVDDQPPGDGLSVVAYIIRGAWQLNLTAVNNDPRLKSTIPQAAYVDNLSSILPPGVTPHPKQQGPYLDMYTVAVASKAQSGLRPEPPTLKTVVAGPWAPLTPPAAEREMVVRVEGLAGAAGVAMARKEGTVLKRVNPALPNSSLGSALLPLPPDDTHKPGVSDFFDRHAAPTVTGYRLAQRDWFGRWSEWAEIGASIGARPKPPRPVLTFDYTPPPPTMNGSVVPLSGTILLKVPIPKPETLPPGSLALSKLEVDLNGVMTETMLPSPLPADNHLQVVRTGPAIPRAGIGQATIVARWVNSANVKSDDSETIKRKLWDPRPAEGVNLAFSLEYGSRPDITGKSRLELRWTRTGVQKRFRVFYADETTIVSAIEKIKTDGPANLKPEAILILGELKTKKTMFDRATLFKDHRNFLNRDMFELLTSTPIEAGEENQVRFVHQVSGSLRVLSFFRIVSVTEANVESDFASSLLIPYAVPNSPRAAQPLIDVEQLLTDDPVSLRAAVRVKTDILPPQTLGEPAVSVSIRVPLGTAEAVGYRLRRSSSAATDPMRMPVVRTGLVPPPLNGDMQQVVLTDTNADANADAPGKLKFWNTYMWRAETRAAKEPVTGAPEGEWGQASAPVSLTLIPPDPPQPVTDLRIVVDPKTRTLDVVCTHPVRLDGGAIGRYKLDVYRQRPGERETYLKSIFADAPPASGGQDSSGQMRIRDASSAIPRGTRYRIIVVDPMGRSSVPSAAVQA